MTRQCSWCLQTMNDVGKRWCWDGPINQSFYWHNTKSWTIFSVLHVLLLINWWSLQTSCSDLTFTCNECGILRTQGMPICPLPMCQLGIHFSLFTSGGGSFGGRHASLSISRGSLTERFSVIILSLILKYLKQYANVLKTNNATKHFVVNLIISIH